MNKSESKIIRVKPDKTRLINLLQDIYDGAYKIPVFQREWAWKPNQILELFDSISKGYPIGSLIFWKPEIEFDTKEFIGPYRVTKKSHSVSYILDGFQRVSTLFGALENPNKFEEHNKVFLKQFSVYYDLSECEFVYLKGRNKPGIALIPLYKIIDTFEFIDFLREIETTVLNKEESSRLIDNAKEISRVFSDYEIPYVEMHRGDIKSAVEIFSRVNSTGTDISEDFMLSALTYNVDTNFLLSDRISNFLANHAIYNFSGLKRDTILNCISNSQGRIYFDVRIEELLKQDIETLTDGAFIHISKAIKFLRYEMLVLDAKLLPYPTQLIFISEYFRLNPVPTLDQIKRLKKWFWITSYSNYFTIYSLSQQRAAYKLFVDFASDKHLDGIYKISNTDEFEAAKFPEKINFTGVRAKALQLFMLYNRYLGQEVPQEGSVTDIYVYKGKGRVPSNMIFTVIPDSGEFEPNNVFSITDASEEDLAKIFFTPDLRDIMLNGDEDVFLSQREEIIRNRERDFVESIGIRYDSSSFDIT
ncbi:DUF262 domain-containing protein [Dyadobacter sp. CY345]|uniref:DUF262 domain-containing protein n=1 Tax=Dyadobacter sp. CY345 TaxID=2909335 RepID=UPI001F2CCC95|nr:DUF262 domain-containing protein [Dyadobacter sp. CY345]MCF2446107.1 DUF262 domain-containing protein [Dyadobacter sp. CY345]